MLSELQKEEILELISLKQEGAYWDFKRSGTKRENSRICYMILFVCPII